MVFRPVALCDACYTVTRATIILEPHARKIPLKLTRWSGILLAAASCRPAASGVVSPDDAPCHVPRNPAARLDTITVAFSERENEAGRLLLRLSGETLIRVDCEGQTRPSLATRWVRDAAGTTWTFELDSTVTSESMAAQWDLRRNGGLWPWTRILGVQAPNPRQLKVRLDSAFSAVPLAFALPQLSATPSQGADSATISVQVYPVEDQRELLDGSPAGARRVDLLITRDKAAISYGGSKPGFSLVPLAWDRTYVLVAPMVRPQLGPDVDALKLSLVREVIRAETRVADGPFWWESFGCSGTNPLLPMGGRPEVVYLQGDETARQIAERVVALQRTRLRATGLPPGAFIGSLAGGEAAMYVLSLARTAPGGCGDKPAWPSQSFITPLVDGRAHAIVRAGVPGFTIEGDGTIRFKHLLRLIPPPRHGQ